MKKITLLFLTVFALFSFEAIAQTDYYTVGTGATSTQVRGPNGVYRYQRSVWILTAAEMTAAGFSTGNIINTLGFNYIQGLDIPATGNIQIYLQNSSDTANTKVVSWATVISPMTSTYNGTVTLPTTVGDFLMPFSTNFTYTGGSLYIAFDYQNAAGPLPSVSSTIPANTTVTNGTRSANSATAAPANLGATYSAFRPQTILGKNVDCARPLNVAVPSFTLNTANVTFNSGSNPANLQYGLYDFNPATAGTFANGVTSPYTIPGLSPSTAYEVYTKTDCGAFLGLSAETFPVSFHTIFEPANPNYNTSFEIDVFPNIGWVADDEPNNTDWFMFFGGTANPLVQNGLYSAVSLSSANAQASGIMYSRGINLQGSNPVTISFYASNYQAAGATNTANFILNAGSDQTLAGQTINIATGTANTAAFVLKSYTFTPPSSGVYYFSLTNASPINGVTGSTHGLIVDNFTVSQTLVNNEVLESKFTTFPNPAKNFINVVNTTDALISGIEITDINGKVVKNQKFSAALEVQVSVSDLAQGIYTMKIVSDKGIVTKKVIKE